jgi:inosine/xanthosine triphosphatase
MKVAVGSNNPVKVNAVKNVFGRIYENVSVEPRKVGSGVPAQPFGSETVQGAMNRAKNAYKSGDFDYGVGIEAGLSDVEGYILDVQFCAIYDSHSTTLGCGSGFEYPSVVLGEVLSGKEVGDVMSRVAGIENLGEKQGAIGVLSKGMLTRTQLTEQSVFMALIPRLNPSLYGH